METVYVATHLIMVICIITVLHTALTDNEAVKDRIEKSWRHRLYLRSINIVKLTGKMTYRIAMSIIISYMK
jgi:hypothetical protein